MIRLLERPWFQRKWVIQEVAYSRQLTLHLGSQSLEWDVLGSLVTQMGYSGLPHQFGHILKLSGFVLRFLPLDNVIHMERLRSIILWGYSKLPLLDIIVETRTFDCHDPRDQIIAIMALTEDMDEGVKAITPNYKISTEIFFKQVATWSILTQKSLRLLSIVCGPSDSPFRTLPSWIPDFSRLSDRYPIGSHFNCHFRACGDKSIPRAYLSNDDSVLHLNGIIVDEICMLAQCPLDISQECDTGFDSTSARNKESVWIKECQSLATNACHNLSAEERKETFYRTMLCDLTDKGTQAPAEYSGYFEGFLKALCSDTEEAEDGEGILKNLQCGYTVEASMVKFAVSRRFCITREGRMGQAPRTAEIGDLICIFEGGRVPFVLKRKVEEKFSFVGESYVHGIMQGEAMNGIEDSMREFAIL
jgi:hypothetical protein